MNKSNKNFYILLSVVLSLLVHVILFLVSRNLAVPNAISDFVQKPSKYMNLGTISLAPAPDQDEILKAKMKRSNEPVSLPPKLASQNFPGTGQSARDNSDKVKSAAPPESFKLPKSPSPDTLQKIPGIDGDKLAAGRLIHNRLIVPKLASSDLPNGNAGDDGKPIELKLRVPMPLKNFSATPGSRLLPDEDLANIDSLMDVRLLKHTEADGSGFFRVDISPRKKISSLKPFEKDIVFCIDTSGSISKDKLNEFKDGVGKSLAALTPGDRFEIVSFKHRAFPLFDSLQNPTPENVRKADDCLKGLERSGSTNIYSALEPFTGAKFKTASRPLILFLASDGNVNTGEVFDSRSLINEIANRNQNNVSIFTFSSGRNKNPFLLELLAYRNRGECFSSEDESSSNAALGKFIQEVSSIIIMDLDYQVSSSLSDNTFPKKLPHLYSQHSLSVYGRFQPDVKEVGLRITGMDSLGKRQELVFAGNLDNAMIADESLPKKWAEQYIYHLYSRLTSENDPNLKMEIYRTAKIYGLDVPYLDKYLIEFQPLEKKLDFKDMTF
ncbi:MAG TPA: hypothetical protein DET40_00590 [Lentisphaeria bacterium]|nr:MAG: hypothetical protein A2X45_09495 [Lentisphaerae bacterium GWF2_50_93]HCE42030.1 hypothetical protein [Lentisphaeria bacterium]